MIEEDVQLIHRILSGDDAAFTALVRKYQKSVHALAWRKIGDFHHANLAENITQKAVDMKPMPAPATKPIIPWIAVGAATILMVLMQGKLHHHNHEHYWYDFWDVPLGHPVGEKGQLYHDGKGYAVKGLFIRAFTNGWAVYNRSGKEQQIRLPKQVSAVASGLTGIQHTLSDLDGEIYLKVDLETSSISQTPPAVDVNEAGEEKLVSKLDAVMAGNRRVNQLSLTRSVGRKIEAKIEKEKNYL